MILLEEPAPGVWQSMQVHGAPVVREGALAQTWARSAAYGVAPDGQAAPEGVTRNDWLDRRLQLSELCGGLGFVESFAHDLRTRGFATLMTDADGVVLRAIDANAIDSAAARARLVEGARWDEPTRGTNAIGTALAETQPVAVVGRAHFEERNHGLCCYAAPVRDAFGTVCGVLDISANVSQAHPLLGTVVTGAARMIEQGLRDRAWEGALPGGLHALESRLSNEAAVIVEADGRVRYVSQKAAQRAGAGLYQEADVTAALGAHMTELFEASLHGRMLHRAGLTLIPEPVLTRAGRIVGCVVRVEQPRTLVSPELVAQPPAFARLFGTDAVLKKTRERAALVARSTLPVLLLAETGTGKELLARAIHEASDRRDAAFLTLNCGAMSDTLLESELFGHAPHAFTGASPRGTAGKLEAANGGTLFLDELAEMPPRLQAMLLRVLEDGTYTRLGETKTRHSDFRLICATCRDLKAMVGQGTFRSDLYFRLRGVTLQLPPLRDRTDKLALAEHLLSILSPHGEPPRLTAGAQALIAKHPFPGNTRELKVALQTALVLADGAPALDVRHFALEEDAMNDEADAAPPSRKQSEAVALRAALESANGNHSEAARTLGVARSTLYRMMRKYPGR